jgi:hypothetical protein
MAVKLSAFALAALYSPWTFLSACGTHFCKSVPRFCQSVHCMDQYQNEPVRLKQIVHTSNTDGGLVALCEIIFSMTWNYRLRTHIDILDQWLHLDIFNVSIQIANKLGNLKKKNIFLAQIKETMDDWQFHFNDSPSTAFFKRCGIYKFKNLLYNVTQWKCSFRCE